MAQKYYPIRKPVREKVHKFVALLRKEGLPMRGVYVFGSQAKGTAKSYSDIDVCVISPRFKDRSEAMRYLWRRSGTIDFLLEPVGYSPKNFVNEDPLVWEIKKYGIKIM